MDSNQFSYSYNTQEYTLPEEQQINYDFPQTQNYESIQEITTSPQEYQKISYQTYEQSNVIDSYNNYDTSNQLNTYDTTNNYEQYTNVSDINGISQTYTPENYDITNINDYNTDYQQSTNYQIDNNITYEDNNINSNYNIENIDYGNNNATLYNEYEYNGQTSLINVENPIYEQNIDYTTQTEIISPPINNYESAQIEENQNISVTPEPQVNQNIENIPNPNQISTSLENQQTSAVNQLSNQDNDSKRGSSPKLVNPLETNEPQTFPAPDIQSMRSDKEPEKEPENINLAQKEEEKEKEINNNNLTKDELNLLKTAKIGSKRKADNLRKLMEDEEERKRQKDDETRKTWQKELDRQILEKNQKNQLEKDRNKIPNYNKFTHEDHECCQNGKCCICKRVYPLNLLNPKKKYASLARIQKMRKQKETVKKGK